MHAPRRKPTLADLDALPPGIKGEIIDGVLYTMTRPRAAHQRTTGVISSGIGGPFDYDSRGPGGWWILVEPGIELPNTPEIAPDLAGWRRERLRSVPGDEPIRIVPDWVCEILSPTTRRHDQLVKRPYYAKVGVPFLWLVDLDARTVTASRLEGGRWVDLGTWADEKKARIPPFEAAPLDVSRFWPPPPQPAPKKRAARRKKKNA